MRKYVLVSGGGIFKVCFSISLLNSRSKKKRDKRLRESVTKLLR